MEKALKLDIYRQQAARKAGAGVRNRQAARAEVRNRQGCRSRTPGRAVRKISKRRRLYRKIILWLWVYFALAGMVATCFVIFSLLFGKGEKAQAADAGLQNEEGFFSEIWDLQEGEAALDGNHDGQALPEEVRQECMDIYARQEELLVLVNRNNELSMDYQPALRNICNGRLQAAELLYGDLCEMLQAAGGAGYEYWIASAHRTREYQQGLVDEDVEKYMQKGYSYEEALQKTMEYTMPAGFSEHETGLALDILCSTNTLMDDSQAMEPGNKWLQEHCQEYGFILRYPADKEEVTGIRYEPWHFRYVGKEAARLLTENGWTLEEYYQVLDEGL